jgi:hypothetical protein
VAAVGGVDQLRGDAQAFAAAADVAFKYITDT